MLTLSGFGRHPPRALCRWPPPFCDQRGVDGAVVDACANESLIVARWQLTRKVLVVAVRDCRHVDMHELPGGRERPGPACLLQAVLQVVTNDAQSFAAGSTDANEEEGT